MKAKIKIAVIGAGPSGLAVLRSFQKLKLETNIEDFELICFEKQKDVGGLWLYDWKTGIGAHGEPVHGSMYKYLWSNGPKECLEFSDYSFLEHFGKPIPSYPPREVLLDYIRGRLKKQGGLESVKVNHAVRWVSYSNGAFNLQVQDLEKDIISSESFDFVICCNGHYSTPNVPEFEGMERFKGRVLHAHDFRSADEFKGKRVLCVGSSYSAEDIGSQCIKYGAQSVSFSYRTSPMRFKWPEGVTTHPLIKKINEETIEFIDGSAKEFDVIILCTGYLNAYPFMEDSLRLKTKNRLYPPNLYKGVVWMNNPKLMYVGMQDQYYTFNMFDAQAWFCRDVILGRNSAGSTKAVPSKQEMEKDIEEWIAKEETVTDYMEAIDFQTDYTKDLLKLSDYPKFSIDEMAVMFKQWENDKDESILGFRDKSAFKSAISGTLSVSHHTKWIDCLDDSMADYLRK